MTTLSAWPTFIDPLAVAIVVGGTLAATAARGPLADTVTAFRALGRMGGRGVNADAVRADVARVERVAGTKGVLAVDADAVADRPTRALVQAVVDGADANAVGILISRAAAAREARHRIAQGWWAAAAEAAPAMGLIGTLIGLVRMFARMDDPAAIGGAMAIALLTTLYGAVLANLIAAPIAARLARLSEREAEARALLAPVLVEFARRASPALSRKRHAA